MYDNIIQNADAISVSKPTTRAVDELMADQPKRKTDATPDVTSTCLDTPGIRAENKLSSVDEPNRFNQWEMRSLKDCYAYNSLLFLLFLPCLHYS